MASLALGEFRALAPAFLGLTMRAALEESAHNIFFADYPRPARHATNKVVGKQLRSDSRRLW